MAQDHSLPQKTRDRKGSIRFAAKTSQFLSAFESSAISISYRLAIHP
jgi:hypothetical protein